MTEGLKNGGNSGNSGNTVPNPLKTIARFVPTSKFRGGNRWEPVENYLRQQWEQWEHSGRSGNRQSTENITVMVPVPTFPTVPTCFDMRGYEGGKNKKPCKRRVLTQPCTYAKRVSTSTHLTQRKQPKASAIGTRPPSMYQTMGSRPPTTRWLQHRTAAANTGHRVSGQENPGECHSPEGPLRRHSLGLVASSELGDGTAARKGDACLKHAQYTSGVPVPAEMRELRSREEQ